MTKDKRPMTTPLNYHESPLTKETATFSEVIPAGKGWIHKDLAGQTLRIVDLEGNQAADTFFFNADNLKERYSAQDTIRGNPASTSQPAPASCRI